MKFKKCFLILVLSLMALSAFAEELVEIDFITEIDSKTYLQNPRLYRAEGEHQCQSDQSIGHACKNLGVNFTDCNQAYSKLKMEDCCSGSR